VSGTSTPMPAHAAATDVRRTSSGMCMFVGNGLEAHRVDTFDTKEPETVAWIRDLMRPGEVFVDVGANVGIYSLYAALVHPDLRVYAFEPYLPNVARLRENVKLNHLSNVATLPVALSDRRTIATFVTPDARIGASGGHLDVAVDEPGNAIEPVDRHAVVTLTLDECVVSMGLPAPNHVKIDVDGAEDQVLAGMSATLAHPSLRSVLVEIDTVANDFDEVRAHLRSHGFSFDNPFERHAEHSRHRRRGTESAHAVNLVAVRTEHTREAPRGVA